tara:strand:- start:272 stop:928 length:657 start_codon:yes stop_codon:yes gene_type:complete
MAIILAILPPILIAYYIYKKDVYEKEPKKLIFGCFLFGCVAILPALFIELALENSFTNIFLLSFFGIALVEEGVKYLFLKGYVYNKKDFNEPMDGIVYAVMISLGFAMVENVMYVVNRPGMELTVAISRMFTAIPLHAVCGVILGYYVGLAKFSHGQNNLLFFKGLFFATLVHAIYNYFLLLGYGIALSFIALIVAISFSKKAIKLHQEDSKNRTFNK